MGHSPHIFFVQRCTALRFHFLATHLKLEACFPHIFTRCHSPDVE